MRTVLIFAAAAASVVSIDVLECVASADAAEGALEPVMLLQTQAGPAREKQQAAPAREKQRTAPAREQQRAAPARAHQHAKQVAKHEAKHGSKHHSALGATAALSREGYEQVAELEDSNEMAGFILRAAADLGLVVKPDGKPGFKGLVPYYSGEKGKRTFGALKTELLKLAAKEDGWLTASGSGAKLSDNGFAGVQALDSTEEMQEFVRRAAAELLDCSVKDEKGLKSFAAFYSGEKGSKPFNVLLEELHDASRKKNSWLVPARGPLQHEGEDCWDHCHGMVGHCKWCGQGNACCPQVERTNGPPSCKGVRQVARKQLDEDAYLCSTPVLGATATLDEEGYVAVSQLKNDTQMEYFLRRAIARLDLMVKRENGLEVLLPFYSGSKEERSWDELERELKGIANAPDNWLAARGGQASLDERGYQAVAKMGSADMSKFIERAVEDMGMSVTSGAGQAWLNGLATFYSEEKTRSDFESLKAELQRIKKNPVGRLAPLKKEKKDEK